MKLKRFLALFVALILITGLIPAAFAEEDVTPGASYTDPAEPTATAVPEATPAPTEEPAPTETPAPTEEPAPVETPAPTEEPAPTEAPTPTEEPAPTETPAPTEEPAPTETPAPTEEPAPTETPAPTEEPAPTETPAPTEEPAPTETPEPTQSPETGTEQAAGVPEIIAHSGTCDVVGNTIYLERYASATFTFGEDVYSTNCYNTYLTTEFLGSNKFRVYPKKTGTTTLKVTFDDRTVKTYKVIIVADMTVPYTVQYGMDWFGLALGDTVTPTHKIYPTTADTTVSFRTSNKAVATVDPNTGAVTGIKVGTATITVTTANGKKDTILVKVYDPNAPTSLSFVEGKSITIYTRTTTPTRLNPVPVPETAKPTYTWKTSNAAVVSVTQDGKILGLKPGTATITVKAQNGKTTTCKVTVVDPWEPTKVSFAEGTAVTIPSDKTYTLKPVIAPATAHTSRIVWKSSNARVVTVDENGVLQPLKEGTATITATAYNEAGKLAKSATIKVTVSDPYKPASISLSYNGTPVTGTAAISWPSSNALRLTYKAVSVGGAGYEVPADSLKWSSSNTSIASIAQDGTVTVKRAGTVTFTMRGTNGVKATAKFTFVITAPLQSIAVTPASQQILTGKTATLTAKLTPTNAKLLVDLKWSSSNTSVATVDQNGVVTGVKAGTATIYARDLNTGIYGATYVVVTDPPVYRAIVAVEATEVSFDIWSGYRYVTCTGVSTRQTDYDGTIRMLQRQNYDGIKWEITGLHTTSATKVLQTLGSVASKAKESDVTLFFFMGHGSDDGAIHFYDDSYIMPATLKKYLDAIPGKVVVMLGSCYSGTYVARGADPANFTGSVMSTFAVGDMIPVTYVDGGRVVEVTADQFKGDEGGYVPKRGELLQNKYYVLTAAAADEYGWSWFYYDYDTNRRSLTVNESSSYTFFVRGVARAGGYDSVSGSTIWSSGKRTLAQVYSTVAAYCKTKPSATSRVQVYPSGSSFVLFQH